MIRTLCLTAALPLLLSCNWAFTEYTGGLYNQQAWSKNTRDPGGIPFLSQPFEGEVLEHLEAVLATDTIIMQCGGLGSARDPIRVNSFLDGVLADGADAWKAEVREKVAALSTLPFWIRSVCHFGNEIGSPAYRENVGGWAGVTQNSEYIGVYVEMYLAPAISAAREVNPDFIIALGSIAAFSSPGAQEYLEQILSYEILGTYAPELQGMRVADVVDIATYHYLATSNKVEWFSVLDNLRERWPSLWFWGTEEGGGRVHANGGATAGTALRIAGEHIEYWVTRELPPWESKYFLYAPGIGDPGKRGDDAMTALQEVSNGCEMERFEEQPTDIAGEGLEWYAHKCEEQRIVIGYPAEHKGTATMQAANYQYALFDDDGQHEGASADSLDLQMNSAVLLWRPL